MDAPKYQQPPLDPAYNQLMAQSRQQDADAAQANVTRETNSLTARYGTLTSGDSAAVMARYGAMLSLAGGGAQNPMAALDPFKSMVA